MKRRKCKIFIAGLCVLSLMLSGVSVLAVPMAEQQETLNESERQEKNEISDDETNETSINESQEEQKNPREYRKSTS